MSVRDSKVETSIIEMPNPEIAGFTAATDVLHASAAETAAGQTTDRDYSKYHCAQLVVDVTALTGTNYQFFLESKDPLSGNYFDVWSTALATDVDETYVAFFVEQNTAQTPGTANTTFTYRSPLTGTTYRLRWAGTFTSLTFSAYIVLKPQ